MTIKESIERIIHSLPSDASFEEINYHLYVFEKIQQANDSEAKNGLIDNAVARERILKCLSM